MKALKLVEKELKKNFGKKCEDYNPLCATCIMWHAYETLKEGLNLK
ncbi:MAG: hypothetical protein WCW13_02440 [archaeon]|jgi:hypothetical protein